MTNLRFKSLLAYISVLFLLSGCARDLASNVYTSDSTLNFTLEGKIISARRIKIKESDRLSDNTAGALGGGALGAAVGAGASSGSDRGATMVGVGLVGAVVGAVVQNKLGESNGYEYIIQVDASRIKDGYYEGNAAIRNVISAARTSGLITVVQSLKDPMSKGQKVYVIFSDKRTRVISAS
ncbi:MAG: hypothetical protein V4485_05865 [Pseudomonadota bacterium]